MGIKEGWTGRVYEDFEVGDIYSHPLGRTVITADNIWFTLLTQNTNPIHFDSRLRSQDGVRSSVGQLSVHVGVGRGDNRSSTSRRTSWPTSGGTRCACPTRSSKENTIYSRSEVLSKRASKSRPNVGIVTVKTTGFNQDGTVVIEYKRTFMVYKRGHVPETARVTGPKPR